jgi:L-aminopeptidase/D-esterase-like protein
VIEIDDGPFTVEGFRLGHWTHPDRVTGCTVIVADRLSPAAVKVSGGSPGTRETALLSAGRVVQGVDAILLTGGSAFGLAAADGVVGWLSEQGRGFPTRAIPVPIVSSAVIFDLTREKLSWPGREEGYRAVASADAAWYGGNIGAGAGATVSKSLGRSQAIRSGAGIAQISTRAGTVSAIVINNAYGDVVDDASGELLTSPGGHGRSTESILFQSHAVESPGENTVIGVVAVDRSVSHNCLVQMCRAGTSGIARVVRPANTPSDGDTIFAVGTDHGEVSTADGLLLAAGAQAVVARATRNAVCDLE